MKAWKPTTCVKNTQRPTLTFCLQTSQYGHESHWFLHFWKEKNFHFTLLKPEVDRQLKYLAMPVVFLSFAVFLVQFSRGQPLSINVPQLADGIILLVILVQFGYDAADFMVIFRVKRWKNISSSHLPVERASWRHLAQNLPFLLKLCLIFHLRAMWKEIEKYAWKFSPRQHVGAVFYPK